MLLHPRYEWVKMVYPDESIVVGQLFRSLAKEWGLIHRTKNTQWHAGTNSPAGVDLGTIRYLCALNVKTFVHLPLGSGKAYRISVETLARAMANNEWVLSTLTTKMQYRKRVFVPVTEWEVLDVLPSLEPPSFPYNDVTHISPDGDVISRLSDAKAS